MAGTAVQRRLIWRFDEVVDLIDETAQVRSLVLAVENYRAAFLYQWLQPADVQADVSMDLVALKQAATDSITGLNQVLAGTPAVGGEPPAALGHRQRGGDEQRMQRQRVGAAALAGDSQCALIDVNVFSANLGDLVHPKTGQRGEQDHYAGAMVHPRFEQRAGPRPTRAAAHPLAPVGGGVAL